MKVLSERLAKKHTYKVAGGMWKDNKKQFIALSIESMSKKIKESSAFIVFAFI